MGYSWSAPCDAHSVLLLFIIAPSFLALYVAALRFNDRRQRRLLVGDDKARHATLKEKSSISAGPAAEHRTTFPPSARSKADQELGPTSSTPPHWNAIPHDKNNLDPSLLRHTTCTGFTVADIQALGRFPDYSKLSGVPAPTPYDNLDISKAKPRPYRPFRWPYHQTMCECFKCWFDNSPDLAALTKMEPDWWIELESTYVERIRQREELYARHGKQVLDCLPGTEMACTELMEMALQFITTRYPRLFSLSPAARPNMFHNRILSTTTDLTTTSPLEVLLHNIPEDFAIVLRDPTTGIYCLRAGIICSSLGWDLATKMGLPLAAIHAPVPDYAEKMAFSMDRFFSRMPTDKPIQRGSWGLERETPLFMPAGHPHEIHRSSQDPDLQVEDCSLRVDWQTLRRLPLTGAVVFNFKALFTPVTDFRHEPYVPALLLKVCKGAKSNIMQYKNTWHTEHVIVPALEQWAQEQVHNGTVPPEWEEGTLAESPFYSGWQEKWIKEQGFAAPA